MSDETLRLMDEQHLATLRLIKDNSEKELLVIRGKLAKEIPEPVLSRRSLSLIANDTVNAIRAMDAALALQEQAEALMGAHTEAIAELHRLREERCGCVLVPREVVEAAEVAMLWNENELRRDVRRWTRRKDTFLAEMAAKEADRLDAHRRVLHAAAALAPKGDEPNG